MKGTEGKERRIPVKQAILAVVTAFMLVGPSLVRDKQPKTIQIEIAVPQGGDEDSDPGLGFSPLGTESIACPPFVKSAKDGPPHHPTTVANLFRSGLCPLVSFLVGIVVLDPLVHVYNRLPYQRHCL